MSGLKFDVVDTPPRAARTILGLRRVGYDFNAAIGDIVDNSISAAAKNIYVDFKRVANRFQASIRDDGHGMTKLNLHMAMTHGSDVEYDPDNLGKFGMGLKTASLSQCRRLLVASNSTDSIKGLNAFMWDVTHIEKVNKWELADIHKKEVEKDPRFRSILRSSGTIVVWEELDRLNEQLESYERPGDADNWVGQISGELRLYLRMTFHRFMDGSLGTKRTIKLFYNNSALKPWDPFCRKEPNTQVLKSTEFRPTESKSKAAVRIEPYVLPEREGKEGFSSLQAWDAAKGLLQWNDSQGFYVYRENRLIHVGGWLRIRGKSEHSKYARVGIFFDSRLDDIFEITVHKMKIKLPGSLFDHLKEATHEAVRIAKKRSEKRVPADGGVHRHGAAVISEVMPKAMERNSIDPYQTNGHHKNGAKKSQRPVKKKGDDISSSLHMTAGRIKGEKFWELSVGKDGDITIMLNVKHPFYRAAYSGAAPNRTKYLDAVFAAIGFTELKAQSTRNRAIFDEMRLTMSSFLAEMARSKLLNKG